jgi:hypothetical protein
MSKVDELRRQAAEAGEKVRKSKSLSESAIERKREKGLNQLADNEDWLDGKVKAKD